MGVFLLPENPAFRRTARSRPHPIAFGMRAAPFCAGLFAAAELLQGGLRRAVAACHGSHRLVDHVDIGDRAASGVLSPLATAVTAS